MGDTRDRAMALATLVEAFNVKDMAPVRVRTYEQGLHDVPVPLLNAAVRRAIATRTFFPKVAELRADAEACRAELLASHPYQPCEACDFTGWVEEPDGTVVRSRRCVCWTSHRARLGELGVLKAVEQRPALPAGMFDARMARVGPDE